MVSEDGNKLWRCHNIADTETRDGVLFGHGVKLKNVAHAHCFLRGEHWGKGVILVRLFNDEPVVLSCKFFDESGWEDFSCGVVGVAKPTKSCIFAFLIAEDTARIFVLGEGGRIDFESRDRRRCRRGN